MEYTFKSDVGIVRPENQDRVGVAVKGDWVLAMLCDGMGGHYGGSKAASIAIQTFEQYFQNHFDENIDYKNKKKLIFDLLMH